MKTWQLTLVTLVALASISFYHHQSSDSNEFAEWKAEFGQTFSADEEEFRKIIFTKQLEEINRHNSQPKKSYEKGINQFSHLTETEFESMFLSSIYSGQSSSKKVNEHYVEPLKEIDWQSLGMVSAVKDQGMCDAGYAFCSASLIESFYLFDKKNVSLSEQQIIDCSADYTTFGCQGGSRNGTLIFIREKGLTLNSAYPYKGVKNTCQKETGEYKPAYTHVEFNGCEDILSNLSNAPMTVAVNAKQWMQYKSGIFDGCTSTEVNHDTYLIGANEGYWRIKNSWGLKWGEYGYIRLRSGNTCGICEKPGFSWKR